MYVPFGIIRALVSDDPPRAASDSSSREMRTSRRRVSRGGEFCGGHSRFYGFAGCAPAAGEEGGAAARFEGQGRAPRKRGVTVFMSCT